MTAVAAGTPNADCMRVIAIRACPAERVIPVHAAGARVILIAVVKTKWGAPFIAPRAVVMRASRRA